ncbi:MAG: ABC transporter permease [Proteobacteria bacterium]|nr:ABC transporter permease [Pseudomonadota bacterium]
MTSAMPGGRVELRAQGAWTVERAADLEQSVGRALGASKAVRSVDIDMGAVARLDTYGAWLLERLVRDIAAIGGEARITGLAPRFHTLVGAIGRTNLAPPARIRHNPLVAALAVVGRATLEALLDLARFAQMTGALAVAFARIVARPWTFRLTSMVHHLDRVGWRALPIIVLITFLLGAIIAQQGIFHFRQFNAEFFVVDMLGVLVLREIGVLMVCVMVAGRSGSAYTAELGAMKMREEIDALRTMGLDPIAILVAPRIAALSLAVPILTFVGSIAALVGGGVVFWLYGGMAPEIFLSRLRDAITLDHFAIGLFKAPFMALVIGIVASVEGLAVAGSAESLGRRTTASVVKAIFLVILLDGLFAMFFAAIGK